MPRLEANRAFIDRRRGRLLCFGGFGFGRSRVRAGPLRSLLEARLEDCPPQRFRLLADRRQLLLLVVLVREALVTIVARRGRVDNETRVDVGRAFRVDRAVLVRVYQTRKHAGPHGRVIIGRRLAELLLLPDQFVQVAVV